MCEEKSLGYHFQPYGTVPPWNSRLLKILPNGMPIFEPVPIEVEPLTEVVAKLESREKEEVTDNNLVVVEFFVHRIFQIERYIKNSTGILDLLRHNVEKYCIIVNYESRQKDKKNDILLKNAANWIDCRVEKEEAIKELLLLQKVFQYTRYLQSDHHCVNCLFNKKSLARVSTFNYALSLKKEFDMFCVAVAQLWKFNLSLLHISEFTLKQIRLGRFQQRRFMTAIRQLKVLWNLQRVTYAFHVYEKGDDYPYRAEILVQLMTIPADCWGYNRPEYSLEESKVIAPPYLSWLPFPPVGPTAAAMAQIFFTSRSNGTMESELGIQMHWIGDSVHYIKSNSLLSVKIIPMRFVNVKGAGGDVALPDSKKFVRDFSKLKPPSVDFDENWLPEVKRVHKRLQAAQWNLVDRAIHLILQAQAARLKSCFDAIAYGNLEVSHTAKMFLYLYEDFECLTGGDVQLTIERWDPNSLALALQGVPVRSATGSEVLFNMDCEVWVFYAPEGSALPNAAVDYSGVTSGLNNTNVLRLCEKLPGIEALATTMLRHYFLSAWKFAQTEIPKICFNAPNENLAPLRLPCGARLFPQFIEWIYNFLSLRVYND